MRRIIGAIFQSLDGVIQAPGTPTEDPTGGFQLGGWLHGYYDEAVGRHVEALFDGGFDLLLGRRTWEIFAAYWPFAKGEAKAMGEAFDRAGKYVLTRGDHPLSRENGHRVPDLAALADLKRADGPDLVIQGSSPSIPSSSPPASSTASP